MNDQAVTLANAVFKYSEVGEKEYQDLVDIAKRHGTCHWENAEHYMRYTLQPDNHVTWFDPEEGLDGRDSGPNDNQVIVPFDVFFKLYCEYYIKNLDEVPVRNPRPRYRKRRAKQQKVAKTIVRVLYTTQQVYTFKNVRSVQIIEDKVYIQHERDITEGIKESSESEINGDLVMAVIIHEVDNRSNFFRNIDGTWDFQNEDGTVVNSGKQLGRIFK